MGIYSTELYGLAQYNVEEAQGYDDGEYSAQIALIEGYQNNLTLFEGAIRCDIQEAAMRYSGVDESEIMVFSENVITSMLSKIKAFIMKVWSKIKAIFRGFMARVDSVMTKSNKEFVNKYRQEVLRKDLTDFEVKWRKPKEQYHLKTTTFPGSGDNIDGVPAEAFKTATWTKNGLDAAEKHLRDWDQDKIMDAILKQTLPDPKTATSTSEYEKDFIDGHFEDEDTDDKIDIHDIMSALLDFKDTKKNMTKANDSLEKALKQMIKDLESDEKEFNNRLPNAIGSDGKYTSDFKMQQRQYSFTKGADNTWSGKGENDDNAGEHLIPKGASPESTLKYAAPAGFKIGERAKNNIKVYQKAIQIIHKYATCYQEAATKYAAANIKAFKLLNSGLRKVWAKAVAYNRKKDESVMMEAMAELAEYEEDII